jgi:hypothetical protein
MRAKLLLSATVIALLAGTTMASAQYMYIQTKDYIESVHGIPFSVWARDNNPAYAARAYGAYGYAPRARYNRYRYGY